jgi:hypothetical protein
VANKLGTEDFEDSSLLRRGAEDGEGKGDVGDFHLLLYT